MNAPLSPTALINPFPLPSRATLADVSEQVARSSLSDTRKRDCLSALRRVADLLEQDLAAIPAEVGHLREKLAGLNPASFRVSAHTWSNLRSNLFRAIEVSGLQPVLRTAKVPLTEPWRDLYTRISDRRTREGLSRFARFCSLNGTAPQQVDLRALQAFAEAVRSSTLARKAAMLERDVATLWNRLVDRSFVEDLTRLDLPNRRPALKRVLWQDLPESFRSDVDDHLVWAAGDDPFAPDPRSRPLSKGSVRLRRQFIQTAVTAFVASGTPMQQITGLRDLVTPEAFKSILRQRYTEAGQQANAYNAGLAKALIAIAKEWVKPGAQTLSELKRLATKLPRLSPGLTDKNTALLRTFEDPDLLQRLIALPDRLWREALAMAPSERRLAKAHAALGIALLTYAPLRIANLSALEFDQTLFLPARADQETLIEIPAAQMKNREAFTIALPPKITAMLRTYRAQVLRGSGFLFDNGRGKPKLPTSVSWLVERTIRRHLGIEMTAHQFRHLAAKVILDADPGAYESVRQLLGQRNLTTTINYYAGLDTRRAGRHHAALIEKELESRQALPQRRRPRRRDGRA
jgi:integrase